MKKFLNSSPLGLVSILLFSTVIFYYACRKLDRRDIYAPKDYTERFFKTPSDVHPAVQKIVDVMRKINDKRKFINKFVEKQGFALWNKAVVTAIRSANTAGRLEASDYSVLIPLVWDDKPMVHSAIAAKVTSDSVYFTVMDGSNYSAYNTDSLTKGLNGRQLSLTLMYLDNKVFGHVMYQINDSASFPYKGKRALLVAAPDSVVPNTNSLGRMQIVTYVICTTIMVPPHEGQVVGCAPDDPNCNGYVPETSCDMYTVVGDDGYGEDGDDPAPPENSGDGGGGNGGNDYCRLFPGGISHNCGVGNPPGWVPISDDNYTPYNANHYDSIHIAHYLRDSFPCLYHFIHDSLENGNKLAQVIGLNLFNDSTTTHITFAISDSLNSSSLTMGITKPVDVFVDNSNITEAVFRIEFNPYWMKRCTKEYMVSVILHEIFHVTFDIRWKQYQNWLTYHDTRYDSNYLKSHYPIFWYAMVGQPVDALNEGGHNALAAAYIDTLADIVRPFYSHAASTATRDSVLKALSYTGLSQTTVWAQLPSKGVDTCKYRAMQISAQYSQTDNSHPAGCASSYHYNYNTDLKLTSNCN